MINHLPKRHGKTYFKNLSTLYELLLYPKRGMRYIDREQDIILSNEDGIKFLLKKIGNDEIIKISDEIIEKRRQI